MTPDDEKLAPTLHGERRDVLGVGYTSGLASPPANSGVDRSHRKIVRREDKASHKI